jgi:large subunit ribosomal protein L1
MAIHGKKYIKASEKRIPGAAFLPQEGFVKIKELAFAGFDESVDVNICLGVDAAKGDQNVRGSVTLPHSFGKAARVIAFAKDKHADDAEKAGAVAVGGSELIEKILGGWMEFDFAVATPDMMGLVGKLAKVLGPKGLLPNKKYGTVTFDVGPIIGELKKGKKFFKSDKSGAVHFTIGKKSFNAQQLDENFTAFLKALVAARPASVKGKYLRKVSAASTMGPGVQINCDELYKG